VKILIVDDLEVNTYLFSKLLVNTGYDIYFSNKPLVALTQISDIGPDLILVDIMMPEMNGFEFVKAIRKLEFHKTPIILFSSIAENWILKKVESSGVNDFISKPLNRAVLIEKISRYIS